MESVAERGPLADGEKFTVKLQMPPAGSVTAQLSVSENSFVLKTNGRLSVTAALPTFLNSTVSPIEVELTG
jgi:hypothetical protein